MAPQAANADSPRHRATCVLVLSLMWTACAAEPTLPNADVSDIGEPPTAQSGALTVTSASQIINQYAVLAANVAAGASSITVTDIADFPATAPFASELAAGDLIMIYQPQGATIDATDTPSYGKVTTLGGAGNYELVHVASVAGNTIRLETGCGGLAHAYTTAGATEVIRVPQLTTLTISGAGSVIARAWDGARGGVVVAQARTSMTIDGDGIDASGQGFRGGAADDDSRSPPGTTTIRAGDAATGAEKGESIAGFQATYDAAFHGRFGRGAPANGGGGGDSHNAGGGGGANGDSARPWAGTGVMDGTVAGAGAWKLDPDYLASGNAPTDSSGGGRGGYTFSQSMQDALTIAPGDARWNGPFGDSRRNVGGLGGHPVTSDPATRLFLGGGGGAGDGNNGAAGAGGRGGGLIVLIADRVSGTGTIQSNGEDGGQSVKTDSFGDAPGGAGAGGTIVVKSNALSGVALHADGGTGGTQMLAREDEAEGPGGGGGGGFIATAGGTVDQTATGALGGTTNSQAVSKFPSNGATSGADGQRGIAIASMPICKATTTDLSITKTNGVTSSVAGERTTYTIVATNHGTDVVAGATVTDTVPAALTGVTWTCTASAGSSCGTARGRGDLSVIVTLAPGGTVTCSVTGIIDPAATGTLANTASITPPSGLTNASTQSSSATDTDTLVPPALDDLGVRGGGCGCQGGGGEVPGSMILIVVALGLRRRSQRRTRPDALTRTRRRSWARGVAALAMLLVLAVAHPASAQIAGGSESFPAERMRLTMDGEGMLDVEWASVPAPLRWNVGTWLGYADNPLVLYDLHTNQMVGSLVHTRVGGGIFGGLGITHWLELGLELPMIYGQTRDARVVMLPSLTSPQLGDLRLAPKLVLRRGGGDRIGVAAIVGFTLPTGGSQGYAGDDAAVFEPELIVSRASGPLRFSGNLGYLARSRKQVANLMVDDEIFARLGAGYRFADRQQGFHRPLELDLTATFATAAASPFSQVNTRPFEVDLAAQYDVHRDVTAFAVAGAGIVAGFGTPDWRIVLGVRYGMQEPAPVRPAPPSTPPPTPASPPPSPPLSTPPSPPPSPPPSTTPSPPPSTLPSTPLLPSTEVKPVYFATDKDLIEARSNAVLDHVAAVLVARPEITTVRVEGHTDNRGGVEHNQDLSQRRAAAVVRYLVDKGVARDRLDAVGFGETRPIADNATDQGRATNRRVEFVIVGSYTGIDVKPATPADAP
jgi:uncharacterized repeat protein (TIGR01451 family)